MATLFVGMGGGLDVVNAAAMYHIACASHPDKRFFLASVREVDRNTFINATAETHHGFGPTEFHEANVPMKGFKVKNLSDPKANYESRFAEPAVSAVLGIPIFVVSPSDAEKSYTLKRVDNTLMQVEAGTPESFHGTKWTPFDDNLFTSRLQALCNYLTVNLVVFVDGGGDALIRRPHHMNIQSAVGNTGNAQAFDKYKADSQDYRVVSAVYKYKNIKFMGIGFNMAVLAPGIDAKVVTILNEIEEQFRGMRHPIGWIAEEIYQMQDRMQNKISYVDSRDKVIEGLENWKQLVKQVVALKPGDLAVKPPKERSLTATTSYYAYGGTDPEGRQVEDDEVFWTGSEWKALDDNDRKSISAMIATRSENIYDKDRTDPKKWSVMKRENRFIFIFRIMEYHRLYETLPFDGTPVPDAIRNKQACEMLQRLADEQRQEEEHGRESRRLRITGTSEAHYRGHLFL